MRLLRTSQQRIAVTAGSSLQIQSDWVLLPNHTFGKMRVGDASIALEASSNQPYIKWQVQDSADDPSQTDYLSFWSFQMRVQGHDMPGGIAVGPWQGVTSTILCNGGRILCDLSAQVLSQASLKFSNGDTSTRNLLVYWELWG